MATPLAQSPPDAVGLGDTDGASGGGGGGAEVMQEMPNNAANNSNNNNEENSNNSNRSDPTFTTTTTEPLPNTNNMYLNMKEAPAREVQPPSGPDEPRPSASNTATAGGSSSSSATAAPPGGEEKKDESIFECNICLDTAKDAVISMCGHLFCWPCLHQWLETRPRQQLCPVCKAAISKEKVIPLYGRGSTNQQDPRTKVPPRPAGQRTEPEATSGGFQGFGLTDGGFHMSFGIGAFPLGYLSSSFNLDGRARNPQRGTVQFEEEQFLSKVFLWVAIIFLAWLALGY